MKCPEFVPSLNKKMLLMLNGPTRRSIIGSVAHAVKIPGRNYENKRWKIESLGDNDFRVTEKTTGIEYLVTAYSTPGLDDWEYGVYKRREE